MELSHEVVQGLITFFFSVISAGLGIWLRHLTLTLDKLRDEQGRMRELFQLKTDAVRDQEQIMTMLNRIEKHLERLDGRIDRRHDSAGAC